MLCIFVSPHGKSVHVSPGIFVAVLSVIARTGSGAVMHHDSRVDFSTS